MCGAMKYMKKTTTLITSKTRPPCTARRPKKLPACPRSVLDPDRKGRSLAADAEQSARPGVERVTNGVTQQVEGQGRDDKGGPREHQEPPCDLVVADRFGQHVPPFRGRREDPLCSRKESVASAAIAAGTRSVAG